MKHEFLQNFKVGDQPLPKEIIDAILNEHSRSIGALKAEKESLETQLQTAKDGLKAFEGVDVKDLQGQITKLQQDLADKDNANAAHSARRQNCDLPHHLYERRLPTVLRSRSKNNIIFSQNPP